MSRIVIYDDVEGMPPYRQLQSQMPSDCHSHGDVASAHDGAQLLFGPVIGHFDYIRGVMDLG